MCIRCGRVTARGDGDGTAWCGGVLPVLSRLGGCVLPMRRWAYPTQPSTTLERPAVTETPLEAA
jgi:hypothetical protein